MTIQVKSVKKTSTAPLKVTFDTPFTSKPIVICTAYWANSQGAVGYVETVTQVTGNDCTITSLNADPAGTYYVNVLAIDSGASEYGSLKMISGNAQKTGPTAEASLTDGHLTSSDPVVMLAPFWSGSNVGVGGVETLDDDSSIEAKITSMNAAPQNYYTAYVASDLGMATANGKTVIAGIANKPAAGGLRVYFPKPFAAAPTVLLSSWWDDGNRPVGGVETLTKVTKDYFELTSINTAPNYYVNWMAVSA